MNAMRIILIAAIWAAFSLPALASHIGHTQGCVTVERMQSDLVRWGYRGDLLRTYTGQEAQEVGPEFDMPMDRVYDSITSFDGTENSYFVAKYHKGCMVDWREYRVGFPT